MIETIASYEGWLKLGQRKPAATVSPFYSRIYAGYTKSQLESIIGHIASTGGRYPVFDPMAGQAFGLSTLSWFGHKVRINDINPAPLLLAWLRSGPVLSNIATLAKEYKAWLSSVKGILDSQHRAGSGRIEFITGWLSPEMVAQLELYGNLATNSSRSVSLNNLSSLDSTLLFRLAVAVLAARRITCHMQSDNRTWLKPGGLNNKPALSQAITEELDVLLSCQLVQHSHDQLGLFKTEASSLEITCADVAHNHLSRFEHQCIGVTSPPYANRLDYSVMWGPELWVISTILSSVSREVIKRDQIGTVQVRKDDALEDGIQHLPQNTQLELSQIRESNAYASKRYYYPFFRQFALDLHAGMQHSVEATPHALKWLVFIRDTTRKDVLFSSHAICESIMEAKGFVRRTENDLQIVRSHVGLLRRSKAQTAVYGLAQREWWLVFERRS